MGKIAIIGSGISGLVSAHLLAREHEVHLFEASSRLGGHTATIDVETPSGSYAVDTGFIVFNDWTYPNFIKLMTQLKVKWKDTEMGFSVKSETTGIEYAGKNFNTLFAQRRNLFKPSYYKMLLDIVRFNKESLLLLESDPLAPQVSLGQYLKDHHYSPLFIDHYIIPMGAAIWSANHQQMQEFPACFFVQFFKNHGMLSVENRPVWKVIQGGSRSYIEPMIANFKENIHLNSPVQSIERFTDHVEITVNAQRFEFDHVVLGAHSDQTQKMLRDPSQAETEILSEMKYRANETVLHTDTGVLPKRKSTWSAWNYWLPKKDQARVALTYHMNLLQGFSSPEDFLVSLNMTDQIDPKKILRKFVYDHPVFTQKSVRAQNRWAEISGMNQRTHYCGAYWGYGFHEDGVKSGVRVAKTFGIEL
jgi:predicted NAD/FAD-binding protein